MTRSFFSTSFLLLSQADSTTKAASPTAGTTAPGHHPSIVHRNHLPVLGLCDLARVKLLSDLEEREDEDDVFSAALDDVLEVEDDLPDQFSPIPFARQRESSPPGPTTTPPIAAALPKRFDSAPVVQEAPAASPQPVQARPRTRDDVSLQQAERVRTAPEPFDPPADVQTPALPVAPQVPEAPVTDETNIAPLQPTSTLRSSGGPEKPVMPQKSESVHDEATVSSEQTTSNLADIGNDVAVKKHYGVSGDATIAEPPRVKKTSPAAGDDSSLPQPANSEHVPETRADSMNKHSLSKDSAIECPSDASFYEAHGESTDWSGQMRAKEDALVAAVKDDDDEKKAEVSGRVALSSISIRCSLPRLWPQHFSPFRSYPVFACPCWILTGQQ